MAVKLFITREYLLERTPIGGNVDNDKIVPHIITAQDIHIQNVLGTKLYEKIDADVQADSLTGVYLEIYDHFIKPMLAHYAASDFYLFHAYEVANGGIYRHQSENSFTPDEGEIRSLHQEQKNKGVHYRKRLTDWLCYNSSQVPEYTEGQEAGMYPDRGTPDNAWHF